MEITTFIERSRINKFIVNLLANIFLKAIRRLNSFEKYNSETIAIISLHKLGDTVFTIPAIREILGNYNNKKFIVFCYSESQPIYKRAFPELESEIIGHNEFWFEGRIAKSSGKKKIRKVRPNIIFDLTGSITSASLIFNIRSREIIGFNKEYFRKIYDVYAPIRKTPHIMDIYLDAIKKKINIKNADSIKIFPVNNNNSNKLLFHALAGWDAKHWGMDKYLELIYRLKDYKRTFIITGGKYDSSMINKLVDMGVSIEETETIDKLMEIIENHSVFIGNDSGPAHIASLLGVPTFIIYGPTNPIFHIPFGKNHEYIQKKIWCSPEGNNKLCYTDGGRKGCSSFECMKQLTVGEVQNKLLGFLASLGIR